MFLINLLFSLPSWLLAVVLSAFFLCFALAGMCLMRRRVLPRMRLQYEDAYYTAAMVQSAMLLYGLIAALTAVSVWQRYSQVNDIVSGEATAITTLWRDLGAYPQPLRDMTRATLRGYTKQIIEEAWPLQRQGIVPSEGVTWMDKLQGQMYGFEPATRAQELIHAEALHAYNQLIQQRRQRLDTVQGGMPGVLWAVLFPGAMLCIVLCLFFRVHNAYYQAALLSGVAVFLAMLLFVIIALDRPFSGDTGIGPGAYQLIYDHHMQ